jgi:hypothetical protein
MRDLSNLFVADVQLARELQVACHELWCERRVFY